MIFITGGAYQGKEAYARENFPEDYKIINAYHLRVKEQLLKGENPIKEAEKLLNSGEFHQEKLILISDEMGSGVVPIDAFAREWREQSGRVNCYFAERAEQVIRVVCGIGMVLKSLTKETL